MKNYKYLLLILLTVGFLACEDTDLEDQGFRFEQLPSYVAFNAPGTGIELDTVRLAEGANTQDNDPDTPDTNNEAINIENTTGTLSNIVVDFEFSGSAVFGTDFTMTNGQSVTASGGSIVIEDDESDVNQFNNINFEIDFPLDSDQDGEKILVITLTGASNLDGETFAVGRGGTEILRSTVVVISDVDCGFATGDYDVNGNILVDDFGSGPYNSTERLSLADCNADGIYAISDISGGLYTDTYAANYNTSAAQATIMIDETTGAVTWTGVSDQFGGEVVEDPAAATPSNWNSGTGVITINWTATAFGERGVTTLTLQ